MAAVSVFLSFVPFQILKRTRQHGREIILRNLPVNKGRKVLRKR